MRSISQGLRIAILITVTVLLSAIVAWVAPHKIPLLTYKLAMVCLAAVAGYTIDVLLFPYAQPVRHWKVLHDIGWSLLMLRQCTIIVGCMVTVGIGL